MGLSKPLIGSVANRWNVFIHAIFSGVSAKRRISTSSQVIRTRGSARSIEQRLQMCVATNAWSEAVAIGLPKCIDADVAIFLAYFPAAFTPIIGAGSLFLSPLAVSGSFSWHVTLIFDSIESEPYGQLRARLRPHQMQRNESER